eukprot:scaffold287224_cov27-Tisochrysis_lutea.AAC.3
MDRSNFVTIRASPGLRLDSPMPSSAVAVSMRAAAQPRRGQGTPLGGGLASSAVPERSLPRINGTTPCLTRRSKRERLSPRRIASSLTTVGRSCRWSPTRTNCLHPWARGTRHEGSVDCAVSSMSTISKISFDNVSPPEATHVARTTSALAMAALPPRASGIRDSMSALTASGRPSRTTFSPAASSPAPMLSTATLESAVARTGRRPSARTQRLSIWTATVVLPVPGGPCVRQTHEGVSCPARWLEEAIWESWVPEGTQEKDGAGLRCADG